MQVAVDPYAALAEALQHAGLPAQRTRRDQVSVSNQASPTWQNRRKSFWLWQKEGSWYLGTWLPVYYRVPEDQDIVALCLACVAAGTSANYSVPAEIVSRFRLRAIDERQFERLFPTEGWND